MKVSHRADQTLFSEVLTQLDTPSVRTPRGSMGHHVIIPTSVAEAALPSLHESLVVVERETGIGIAVGTITDAIIADHNILVQGVLNAQQFPHEVAFIERHQDKLGCAYILDDVEMDESGRQAWILTKCRFAAVKIQPKKDIA